jgi:hypothetical protein
MGCYENNGLFNSTVSVTLSQPQGCIALKSSFKKREEPIMPTPPILLIFAALCGVFFFAIAGVAVWEWIRFGRGESALSARHFRWRLLSAATWLVVLGAFFVATVFMWPHSTAEVVLARRFFLVMSGAMLLMLFAFVLMAVDIFWTIQVGRKSIASRSRQSQEELRREMERATKRSGDANGTS